MDGEWELLATRPGGTATSLIGVGNAVLAATPCGLRRSTDDGRSWTIVGWTSIELVVPSPDVTSDATLFGGTADGLLRSTDGGHSWQAVLVGSRVYSIVCSPRFADDGLILVGTEQDGILRSTDRGKTWASANPGLLDLTVLGMARSPAFEVDHTVFAATASGLFRSTNAARTWRGLDAVPGEPAVQCVALSPAYATEPTVLAGTEADGLLRSIDAGTTWHAVADFEAKSVTALAWSNQRRVAAATDTGVMVSYDDGATWQRVGADQSPVVCVAFTPDGALLAGRPRRGIVRSTDFQTWELSNAGLQANLVVGVAVSAEGRLYLAGLEDGVVISTDAGSSWHPSNGGLRDDPAVFGLAAGPAGTYAATSTGVFRQASPFSHWAQVHAAPARVVRAAGQRLVALGMQADLTASEDSGGTWQTLAWPASAGQPVSLAVVEPATILVGTSLPATTEVAVWRTTNGQDWQRLLLERGSGVVPLAAPLAQSLFAGVDDGVLHAVRDIEEVVQRERRPVWRRATLPAPVSALEASPAYRQDRTVVAATTAGLFVSRDGGVEFQAAGFGDVPVVAVAFSPSYPTDRLVYAVELGGRIWRLRDTT